MNLVLRYSSLGPVKSFCHQRLMLLEQKFNLHGEGAGPWVCREAGGVRVWVGRLGVGLRVWCPQVDQPFTDSWNPSVPA
jgi:hypothetical protein